jgi:mutator protein MutT
VSGTGQAIEVAAALVFRAGKLLIAQRCHNSHLGGLWEFPGGKREPGESWAACLGRELREELGIEVEVGFLLQEVVHQYPGKTVHIRFFNCTWVRHDPKPLGCADFRWVTREELDGFDFPEADAGLVRDLISTPAFWAPESQ